MLKRKRTTTRMWRRFLAWMRWMCADEPAPSQPPRESPPLLLTPAAPPTEAPEYLPPIPVTFVVEPIATRDELAAYAKEDRQREQREEEFEAPVRPSESCARLSESCPRPSESKEGSVRGPRPPPRNKSSRALRVPQ
jgi:hypothetical protein